MSTLKYLKDSDGSIRARVLEDKEGNVIEVITYNDCKEQKWLIVDEKTEHERWRDKIEIAQQVNT